MMKKLYWRPQRVSARVLVLLSFVALCSLAAVETFKVTERQPYHRDKMRAAHATLRAFRAVKAARLARNIPIDPETDPMESGLLGELISPITTNTGHAPAKQTSVNPNFAAVVVDMLKGAGVRQGDVVAVGVSGSFPAINIAAIAAVEAIGARPVLISSASASQWGANHPEMTWLDMEKVLHDERIISVRSVGVSVGGIDDRGVGLSARGKRLLLEAIERNGLTLLDAKSYVDGIDRRMALFREHAADTDIAAYINVGGGSVSVGTRVGKELFKPGLNKSLPRGPSIDSVMTRFATKGVPVIHLIKIEHLAERYGLPLQPQTMQAVGEGAVFVREAYSRWLAAAALAVLIFALIALLRFDLGHRLLRAGPDVTVGSAPEPMV